VVDISVCAGIGTELQVKSHVLYTVALDA
jgi:hypothetical protein